jgi:methionyl-tRNA formyltransferase
MTGDQLRQRLATLGTSALLDTLQQIARGEQSARAQDDALSTYAPKLSKGEAWIDWSRDALDIARTVRAFCSANVAVTALGEQRIKIWMAHGERRDHQHAPGTVISADNSGITVACGTGVLRISRLQLPGGKPLDVGAVLNARRAMFEPGTVLQAHEPQ